MGSIFDPTQVVLSEFFMAPSLPGDYNNNGAVDAADYVIWRKNVGLNATLPNDAVGGVIGASHYSQWKSNFGAFRTMGGGPPVGTAVPEPSTLLLLLAAAASIVCQRRYR